MFLCAHWLLSCFFSQDSNRRQYIWLVERVHFISNSFEYGEKYIYFDSKRIAEYISDRNCVHTNTTGLEKYPPSWRNKPVFYYIVYALKKKHWLETKQKHKTKKKRAKERWLLLLLRFICQNMIVRAKKKMIFLARTAIMRRSEERENKQHPLNLDNYNDERTETTEKSSCGREEIDDGEEAGEEKSC